ncbi:MAG: DUF1905 domain-containing protein [Candidatus Puniceispirillaceae bacterium]
MMDIAFTFTGRLWEWPAKASWFFITLPSERADEVRFFTSDEMMGPRRGFGSVRVAVCIGKTSWQTSLFPDKQSGSYVLPVKAAVRAAETIKAGDDVRVTLRLLMR